MLSLFSTTNLADLHDGDSDVIDTNHAQTPKSEPENEDTDAGDMQELSEGNMSGIGTDHDDAEEYDTLLPPTLETRKKKKLDSAAVPDKGNTLASDSATAEYGCQSIPNPEYKRRLEDGDRGSPPISVENNDDPQSNQPAYSPQSTVPPWTETPDSLPDQLEGQAPADDGLAQREILKPSMSPTHGFLPNIRTGLIPSPESTNVSMSSPNKSRSTEQKEKCYQASSSEKHPEPYKPASRKRRLHERKGFVDMTVPKYQNFSQNEQASLAENHEEEALFAKKGSGSPVSELPVTQRWLEPGTTSDIPAVPSRATRRQRGVVSYAEPNLRGKMRRSTNEFVDAVAGHNSRDIRTSMDQGDVNEHEYSAELKVTMGDNLVDSNGSRSYKSERANRDTVSGSEGSLQVQSNKPTRRSVSKRKRGSLEDTCGPLNGQDNLDASMATDTSDWVQRDQQDCGMVETECGPISDSAALDQTRPVESTTKVNNTTHTTRKGSRRYSSNPRAAGAKRLPQDNLTVSEPRCASSTKEYDKLNIAVSSKTDSRIPGTEVQFIPCKSDAHSASLTGEVRVKHGQQLAARRRSTML